MDATYGEGDGKDDRAGMLSDHFFNNIDKNNTGENLHPLIIVT